MAGAGWPEKTLRRNRPAISFSIRMDVTRLKQLLLGGDPDFWAQLEALTKSARDFEELFLLSSLRKKAHARKLARPGIVREKIRLALLGGYSLYPLHELVEHLCELDGYPVELWPGDYDNYISEIMEDDSELYAFVPNVVFCFRRSAAAPTRAG